MQHDIKAINEKIQRESAFVDLLTMEVGKTIVGQKNMVERLLIGLLANGHILLEGVPGLAKTMAVKTLANCIQAKFQRIQFTPDLLPADLVGRPPALSSTLQHPADHHHRPGGRRLAGAQPHLLGAWP